jgi:hypothetical protein
MRAQELEQRYGDFRVAVQSALDAGEAVTYPEIVQRLGRRDRRVAQAALGPAALRGGSGGGAGDAGGGGGGSNGLEQPPKGAHGSEAEAPGRLLTRASMETRRHQGTVLAALHGRQLSIAVR